MSADSIKTYLVGGAVRDELLGLHVTERDWVVVGSTPETMLAAGYRPVGKNFPVFLHPKSQEEYALARTERKTGPGYTGFSFHAAPDVSLEDDLQRRDLTINAMAADASGNIIDPYGGQADLDAKLLRHVSDAFVEDPLRVLRIARFAARFAHLGFTVAPDTQTLLTDMSASGELDHLVPERVWTETVKALASPSPQTYVQVLRDCHALKIIFPEVEALFGVPQNPKYHPEIDCGIHTLLALEQSARLSASPRVRFAALVHDLGKATTSSEILPSHRGHEARGVPLIEALCDRLKAPNDYRRLAAKVSQWHLHCHRAFDLRADTILRLLNGLDAFRRPLDFEDFLLVCEADARGRTGLEDRPYPGPEFLNACLEAALSIDSGALAKEMSDGEAIREAIQSARVEAIKAVDRVPFQELLD